MMKTLHLILLLPIMVAACSSGWVVAGPEISRQVLFEKPASRGEYRIPGILALKDGTVLAFCADRKGRGDFGHDTTTVLRRSLDGGKTWGPMREITARAHTDIHSGPVVQDRETGRVFKFCRFWPAAKDAWKTTNSKTYLEMTKMGWIDHVQTSNDAGETWSAPQPVRLNYPPGAVSAATGNGVHGIQLSNGRLLIQGGYSERRDRRLLRRCFLLASDNCGKSWERIQDIDTAEINTVREFVVAEKLDGTLYCNIRSALGWRAILDGKKLHRDDELRDVECHAGLAVWQQPNEKPVWFFSHPNPTPTARKGNFSQRRQRLVLRISRDEGKTWHDEIVIHDKAAAYSDVTVLPDRTVLVLFENGDRIGEPYQRISLARLRAN